VCCLPGHQLQRHLQYERQFRLCPESLQTHRKSPTGAASRLPRVRGRVLFTCRPCLFLPVQSLCNGFRFADMNVVRGDEIRADLGLINDILEDDDSYDSSSDEDDTIRV